MVVVYWEGDQYVPTRGAGIAILTTTLATWLRQAIPGQKAEALAWFHREGPAAAYWAESQGRPRRDVPELVQWGVLNGDEGIYGAGDLKLEKLEEAGWRVICSRRRETLSGL
jgi:hypothetical protein